ncbi:putative glycolipid-binding domain-containing protein [Glaciibacter sp. 2TAF33]|uniref:putative glycolipid-binding domain-containing protein n=1 Tax=Glaciibacter sp. 2TAF33 TaxID=3233015 RepID=UPI003F8E3A78
MIVLSWDGLESNSRETCSVSESEDGIRVESIVDGTFGHCTYTLIADDRWEFRSLALVLGSRSLRIECDGAEWTVDSRQRRDLEAAREVDIAISPLTNTLPVRRLGLAIGESVDITTAYVAVPDLTVVADPQRYTRLADREYRYESRDSTFERVITVDEHGLVVTYPGLFARTAR